VSEHYPCPCCGYLVFDEAPGSYDICEICYWEDDVIQLRWPDYAGGANSPSLIEAQLNFINLGAKEARLLPHVRPATPADARDPLWKAIDPLTDRIERDSLDPDPWPEDDTTLYWWRPTYWRSAEPRETTE
jgi:hypothetical protein